MIEHSIDSSLHLLEVRVSDSVKLLDLVNFIATAQKDLQYGPSLNTLFVVDPDTDLAKLSPASFSTFFGRVEESGGAALWAIVASNESHNSTLASAVHNFIPHRLNVRVFDDEFLALQWLKVNDTKR